MSRFSDRLAGLSVAQRALLAEKLAARLDALESERSEPIAVVGMACRFPGGASSPGKYWELIRSGAEGIVEVPSDRWDVEQYYDPRPGAAGKTYSRWGGFIDGVDQFDPRFFGIAPREASSLDPQQRLALEITWEAIENAGTTNEELAGSPTGVFMGSCNADYQRLRSFDPRSINVHSASGVAANLLTGRISYWLDLKGPSITLDTACSSSLVAVHVACQSLRNDECRTALAGGVNLMLSPEPTIAHSKIRLLSKDGRCKVFDARADGIVRGEGAGVVVLRPLGNALERGDRIMALIRGSAVNQDGRSNGLTAPSGSAQQELVRQALANAGVAASEVGYVEAHGTGTALGDPIEAESLCAVLGKREPGVRPCTLGSVKANIGHLEGAAGVAGLIKSALVLQNETLPPQIHFERPNPQMSLEEQAFVIPRESTPWPREGERRVAGVSSFGWSGTNAHVVLEEPPNAPQPTVGPRAEVLESPTLVPISARSEGALRQLLQRYVDLIASDRPPRLDDVAYSASVRRSHFERRLYLVVSSIEELGGEIKRLLQYRGPLAAAVDGRGRRGTAFIFPDARSADFEGAEALLESERRFREVFEECDASWQGARGTSLRRALRRELEDGAVDASSTALCFAVQLATARLWMARGIEPDAVLSDGVGSLAAACGAGAISIDAAMRRLRGEDPLRGEELSCSNARIPCFAALADSSSDGAPLGAASGGPTDWRGAVQRLLGRGYRSFVVLGRSPPPVRDLGEPAGSEELSDSICVSGVEPSQGLARGLLVALGRLYVAGHRVVWSALHGSGCRFIDLPHHPFLRDRYWLETDRCASPTETAGMRRGDG